MKFLIRYLIFLSLFLCTSTTNAFWSNNLTVNQENILKDVLKKHFHSDEIQEISELKGLSTSKLFRIKLNEQDLVLRLLDSQRSNDFYNSISQEIESMRKMSNYAIAPYIYWCSENENMILMDYISHNRITEKDLDTAFYCKLATALRQLHQCTFFSYSKSAFESIREMAANINLPELALECISKVEILESILKLDPYLAPCHRDLNTGNILNTPTKVYFIDWETAANDDPFFDLATISNFLVFEKDKDDLVMNTYFFDFTEKQKAHLHLMKIVSLCYYGLTILKITKSIQMPELSIFENLPNFKTFAFNIRKGFIDMKNPANLTNYGFVMLREALHQLESAETLNAIRIMSNSL